MSQEKVLKALEGLGLEKADSQVYIFLGKKGPQKGKEISKALKISKQRLYLTLKNLQNKGLVNATLERPAKFSAMPFEKALDLFVKAKMEEAHRIQNSRTEILSDWQKISISETSDQSPKFTVIEGKNYIYPRYKQMIEDTTNQLSIISSVSGLVRAEQFGIIDAALNHTRKTNAKFRFLTELSEENMKPLKLLLERVANTKSSFEGRSPELGLKLISRMLIRDDDEVAFFVNKEDNTIGRETDDLCLWTNSKSLVQAFKGVFEDLWRNSTDIQTKIDEIETGKPIPRTCVLSDTIAAKSKYNKLVDSAKEELLMITSAEGLFDLSKKINHLKSKKKSFSTKIMAPITGENIQIARDLSKYFEIKHVPRTYLRTTIIDGQHLFQFKTPASIEEHTDTFLSFENTIYSNEPEYVERMKIMFYNIWGEAHMLFADKLQTVSGPSETLFVSPPDETLKKAYKNIFDYVEPTVFLDNGAKKSILNRLVSAKRKPLKNPFEETLNYYGSIAQAFVQFPEDFNLPKMMMQISHFNEQSSFGAENLLMVYTWLETPKGHTYVPSANISTNPKSTAFRKSLNENNPIEHNFKVFRKNQFEVRVQGNTFFAGWTRPISLFPTPFLLPPAGILFEGYGDLRTSVKKIKHYSGRLQIHENNEYESFVTFFHPNSKFSIPGTEGLFFRDSICTSIPPTK
jgi:sugar-specific transcriptional regulator TrmB